MKLYMDKFKWELPEDVLEFVNEYFNNYVPDKTVKESILLEYQRPDNLPAVKTVEKFFADNLKEKKKS